MTLDMSNLVMSLVVVDDRLECDREVEQEEEEAAGLEQKHLALIEWMWRKQREHEQSIWGCLLRAAEAGRYARREDRGAFHPTPCVFVNDPNQIQI